MVYDLYSSNVTPSVVSPPSLQLFSPMLLFKDDDPEYIHNSLNIHLDMEVFSTEGEHFKMIFKVSWVISRSEEQRGVHG